MFLKRQEVIEFDPNNKAHRAAARAFLKRKAWVDSPLRFTHDPGYGSVADQVQAKLLDWYVAQEEAKEAKKSGSKSQMMVTMAKEIGLPIQEIKLAKLPYN